MGFRPVCCLFVLIAAVFAQFGQNPNDPCGGAALPQVAEQVLEHDVCPPRANTTSRLPTMIRYKEGNQCLLLITGCVELDVVAVQFCFADYRDVLYYFISEIPGTAGELSGEWFAQYPGAEGLWFPVYHLRCGK